MKTLPVILSHLFVVVFLTLRQTALAASRKVLALLGLVQQRKSNGACPKRTHSSKKSVEAGL